MSKFRLRDFIEYQKDLNAAMGKYPATPEVLACAIGEECGEVLKEAREYWRWWSWGNNAVKSVDRAALIGELNDVFKFVLVGLLCFSEEKSEDIEYAAQVWDKQVWNAGEFVLSDIGYLLGLMPNMFICSDGGDAILRFTQICVLLGVEKAEIEAAYLKKWQVNKVRIKEG